MSLLNVWASPDRVLVAVDTKAFVMVPAGAPTRFWEVAKAVPLIQWNGAVAGRGHLPFITAVVGLLHSMPLDFEEAVEAMPAILPRAYEMLLLQQAAHGLTEDTSSQQIVLAGFSPRRQRMVAMLYAREESGAFAATEVSTGRGGWWLSAWDDDEDGAQPEPLDADAMRAVARTQMAWLRRRYSPREMPAGGRLLCIDMTPEGIAVSQLDANL